jgi:hypothetical protein
MHTFCKCTETRSIMTRDLGTVLTPRSLFRSVVGVLDPGDLASNSLPVNFSLGDYNLRPVGVGTLIPCVPLTI